MVLHWRLHHDLNHGFKVSHLRYAVHPYTQYQVTVKLLGSFRLAAGNRHLHRSCIFTELLLETVPKSLHHSCTSEFTRQGITLNYSHPSWTISLPKLSFQHVAYSLYGSMRMNAWLPDDRFRTHHHIVTFRTDAHCYASGSFFV